MFMAFRDCFATLAMTDRIMKRKTITKIVWIIVSAMIIFTMVLWTVGVAFM